MWMIAATRGGDGWLWYAIAGVVALFGGEHRGPALASATVATAGGIALFMKLKRMIGRKRPCALEPHCWAKLLPPDQFSFPSGHTITAFAVAISLSSFYPEMEPFLLFCAVSIAASRVVLGMHYLSDVVAGSLIGTVLAVSAVTFFN
jgi:undecaprenyl-diphosphatase